MRKAIKPSFQAYGNFSERLINKYQAVIFPRHKLGGIYTPLLNLSIFFFNYSLMPRGQNSLVPLRCFKRNFTAFECYQSFFARICQNIKRGAQNLYSKFISFNVKGYFIFFYIKIGLA